MENKLKKGVTLNDQFLPFTYTLYENGFEIIDDYMVQIELNNSIRVLTLDMIIDGNKFNTIQDLINYIYGN
jgi:hypothetical protein